jgi:hypothetical protein
MMGIWNIDRSKVSTAVGVLLIAFASSIAATLGALTDNPIQSMLPPLRPALVEHVVFNGMPQHPMPPR